MGLPSLVNGSSVVMLAEDLSNFVDVGKAIASADADTLKSFAKDLFSGIARNEFITRRYTAETNGIVKTVDAYNGALQRIALKNLPEVQESHARKLVSGVNYFDGKFYGADIDAMIFSDEFDFKIPYSIGYEDIRAKFDNMEWVDKTIASIETAVHNSLEIKLKGVADTLLNKCITDAIDGNREVKLVTKFNEYFGYTPEHTWAEIKASETLMKQFVGFVSLVIGLVKGGLERMNQKYNNGSIPTFTPSDKISIVGLTEFMKTINNFGYANIYNENLINKENVHETVCWQSVGADMVPLLTTTGTIKDGTFTLVDGAITSETATSKTNIVMVMYDNDCMGVTTTLDRIGVEEIGSELYMTYFHHFGIRQFLDERCASVVFTLS